MVEEQKNSVRKKTFVRAGCVAQLKNVIAYLNDHYAFDIPLERLCKNRLYGTTKLKTSFKQLQDHDLEITFNSAMSQASIC